MVYQNFTIHEYPTGSTCQRSTLQTASKVPRTAMHISAWLHNFEDRSHLVDTVRDLKVSNKVTFSPDITWLSIDAQIIETKHKVLNEQQHEWGNTRWNAEKITWKVRTKCKHYLMEPNADKNDVAAVGFPFGSYFDWFFWWWKSKQRTRRKVP